MPSSRRNLLAASGNGGASLYVEDVFSTYLYTGNGASQTITNGIDLAGEGGMVWIKSRSAATAHQLFDTERGATKELISNTTAAQATDADTLTGFNSDGFDLGADSNTNNNAATYASWTFRKAPKFFDVVTYTGDGTVGREIAHELGAAPGAMIVKRTDDAGTWFVYHRGVQLSGDVNGILVLNDTAPSSSANGQYIFGVGTAEGDFRAPTETDIIVNTTVNASGATYVAYLFAHEAGGFGPSGTDSVISCGSFTGTGAAGNEIVVGFEPRWLLVKRVDSADNWSLLDGVRGLTTGSNADKRLLPNVSDAEYSGEYYNLTSTGFVTESGALNGSGGTYLYIAIA